eukprot:4048066-Pleurochrysis_carterae.AAC.1
MSRCKALLTALLLLSNVPTGEMAPKEIISSAANALATSTAVGIGCNSCRAAHLGSGTSSAAFSAPAVAASATAAAVAACAAAVAARAAYTRKPPPHCTDSVLSGAGGQTGPSTGTQYAPPAADDGGNDESADSEADEDNGEEYAASEREDGCEDEERAPARPRGTSRYKKLWNNDLFPRGMKGANNYEMKNLLAVQSDWKCTCRDRDSCLSPDRINIIELY